MLPKYPDLNIYKKSKHCTTNWEDRNNHPKHRKNNFCGYRHILRMGEQRITAITSINQAGDDKMEDLDKMAPEN